MNALPPEPRDRDDLRDRLSVNRALEKEAADLLDAATRKGISVIEVLGYTPLVNIIPQETVEFFDEVQEQSQALLAEISEQPVSLAKAPNRVKSIDFSLDYDNLDQRVALKQARVLFDNGATQVFGPVRNDPSHEIFETFIVDAAGIPLVLLNAKKTYSKLGYLEVLAKLREFGLTVPDENAELAEDSLNAILQQAKKWTKCTESTELIGAALSERVYLKDYVLGGKNDTDEEGSEDDAGDLFYRTSTVAIEIGPEDDFFKVDTSLQLTLRSRKPYATPRIIDLSRVPISYKIPTDELRALGVQGFERTEIEAARETMVLTLELVEAFRTALLTARLNLESPMQLRNNFPDLG